MKNYFSLASWVLKLCFRVYWMHISCIRSALCMQNNVLGLCFVSFWSYWVYNWTDQNQHVCNAMVCNNMQLCWQSTTVLTVCTVVTVYTVSRLYFFHFANWHLILTLFVHYISHSEIIDAWNFYSLLDLLPAFGEWSYIKMWFKKIPQIIHIMSIYGKLSKPHFNVLMFFNSWGEGP